MGILKKDYEISLWQDNLLNGVYTEQRIATIGGSNLESPMKAQEPKLVRKINGQVTLSFKMYNKYTDTLTGTVEDNIYVHLIENESKIKLRYDTEWFDFIVKKISQDSSNKSVSYELVDQHTNELSRNGYNIELDASLMNNIGSITTLATKALEGSNWGVVSEPMIQTTEEVLVPLKVESLAGYEVYQIKDADLAQSGITTTKVVDISQFVGKTIYAFYSSCSSKPHRFQFIYFTGAPAITSGRIIKTSNTQYYIDGIQSWNSAQSLFYPNGTALALEDGSVVSVKYKGARYVFPNSSVFHPGLNSYVTEYRYNGDNTCYRYDQTVYTIPSQVKNYVSDSEPKATASWKGNKFCSTDFSDVSHAATVEILNLRKTLIENNSCFITSTEEAIANTGTDIQNNSYSTVLACSNLKNIVPTGNVEDASAMGTVWKAIVNSGPYDKRKDFDKFKKGEKYVIKFEGAIVKKEKNKTGYSIINIQPKVRVRMAKFINHSSLMGYDKNLINASTFDAGVLMTSTFTLTAQGTDGYFAGVDSNVEVLSSLSTQDFLKDKYQLIIDFPEWNYEDTENAKYYFLIKKLQFYKKNLKADGINYYTPEDEISTADIGYTINELYFTLPAGTEEITVDNRTEDEIEFLPSTTTTTLYLGNAEKKCAVTIKESNYFNAIQTIAETFQCWPKIEVNHDENGKIINFPGENYSKRVHFKNTVGQENAVGFRYGVNSQSIKRTLDSQQITTKLITKNNSNQFATNGFCSISRAAANDIKDNVLYNFDYYVQQQMLDDTTLQQDLYYTSELEGAYDFSNVSGYYLKAAYLNNAMSNISERMVSESVALATAQSDYTVNLAGYEAANSQLIENIENFYQVAGFNYNNIAATNLVLDSGTNVVGTNYCIGSYNIDPDPSGSVLDRIVSADNSWAYLIPGTEYSIAVDITPSATAKYFSIHVCGGMYNLTSWMPLNGTGRQIIEQTFTAPSYPFVYVDANGQSTSYELNQQNTRLNAYARSHLDSNNWADGQAGEGTIIHSISIVRGKRASSWTKPLGNGGSSAANKVENSPDLKNYLVKISELSSQKDSYYSKYVAAEALQTQLASSYETLYNQLEELKKVKSTLTQALYDKYGRFIHEGTWIDESYSDDELYYFAAQSVLYNSAKPKVTYNLSVISLACLPGWEAFDFKLGDQTFIEDTEFFGYDAQGKPFQERVTLTETSESLDDPTKTTIKIQNYENQFSDLFRKINATVQQVKYTEGSYKKAAELAEADTQHKITFLTDALNSADMAITNAGNQTVVMDNTGITITDADDPGKALRMVAGAILIKDKKEDETETWKTGLTADGISANLITAGRVNTGTIQIMNGNEPTFRWDSHGITAYDFNNNVSDTYLSGLNKNRGVRFDRFGLYGYSGIDGETWKPKSISNPKDSVPSIDEMSTFYLTWEGLKVKNTNGATLRIGDNSKVAGDDDSYILKITDKEGHPTLRVDSDGHVEVAGSIKLGENLDAVSNDKNLVVTNVGIGEGSMGEGVEPYVEIGANGLLQANNAIIHGTVYANAGQIGNMTIGDLNSLAGKITGRNLAIGTADNYASNAWSFNNADAAVGGTGVVQYETDRHGESGTRIVSWFGNETSSDAVVGPYINTSVLGFKYLIGEVYTLSVWLRADTTVSINPDFLRESHASLEGSDDIDTTITTEWKRFSVTFKAQAESSNICFYTSIGSTEAAPKIYMCGLKIEQGAVATDWCRADEDVLAASVDNTFSWKFSPSTGLYMYNGGQAQGNEVFKIYKPVGEDSYTAWLKGEIEALSGQIGGEGGLTIQENGRVHVGTPGEQNSLCLSGTPMNLGEVDVYGNYEYENILFSVGNQFFVDNNGYMYSKDGWFSGTLWGTSMFGGTIAIGGTQAEPKFSVDENGNVRLNGSITWGQNSSPAQAVYASLTGTWEAPSAPANGSAYEGFPESASNYGEWHKNFDDVTDQFASYTYDGGNHWTVAIKIKGTDGSDADVNKDTVIKAFLEAEQEDGIYAQEIDGKNVMCINASAIKAGILSVGVATSTSANGIEDTATMDSHGFFVEHNEFGTTNRWNATLKGTGLECYEPSTGSSSALSHDNLLIDTDKKESLRIFLDQVWYSNSSGVQFSADWDDIINVANGKMGFQSLCFESTVTKTTLSISNLQYEDLKTGEKYSASLIDIINAANNGGGDGGGGVSEEQFNALVARVEQIENEHKISTIATAATCGEDAYTTYSCSGCDYEKVVTEENTATGAHIPNSLKPTSSKWASNTYHMSKYTCRKCKKEYEAEEEHQYNRDEATYVSSSDIQHLVWSSCMRCGEYCEKYEDHFAGGYVDKYETYDSWNHQLTRTCPCGYETAVGELVPHTLSGVYYYNRTETTHDLGGACTVCGDEEIGRTENHTEVEYSDTSVCKGTKCSACGYVISAPAHTFPLLPNNNLRPDSSCTCKYFKCSKCGYVKQENTPTCPYHPSM